jgi:hypothetical protein
MKSVNVRIESTRLCSASVLALFLFTGCAQQWVKQGANAQDYERDKGRCTSDAAAKYPPAPQTVQSSSGYEAANQQPNCYPYGNQAQCASQSQVYLPASLWYTVDGNLAPRQAAFEGCLASLGWQKVSH